MLKRALTVLCLVVWAGGGAVVAAEEDGPEARLTALLSQIFPGQTPDVVRPAPLPGMYEAIFGPAVLYLSPDGRYLLEGDLIDLREQVNLTEQVRAEGRRKVVASIPEESMIIFRAENPRYTVTVFTDVDCPYCRRMHQQMADYLAAGITIRYLAYPRSGLNTPSYHKAVSVWCAEDRQAALTRAKAGEMPEPRTCDNPVSQHMALGNQIRITGTPTLILEDGRVLPGYVPPRQLLKVLQEEG